MAGKCEIQDGRQIGRYFYQKSLHVTYLQIKFI